MGNRHEKSSGRLAVRGPGRRENQKYGPEIGAAWRFLPGFRRTAGFLQRKGGVDLITVLGRKLTLTQTIDQAPHLARHRLADLFLDTLP